MQMIRSWALFAFLVNSIASKAQACDFKVILSSIDTVTSEKGRFSIEIKNISKRDKKLPDLLEKGYLYDRDRTPGNLIIELQCKSDTNFVLLPPTADIDPVRYIKDFNFLYPGKSITDALILRGTLWRKGGYKGFKPGEYRVRVIFNEDEWGKLQNYISNWVYFKID